MAVCLVGLPVAAVLLRHGPGQHAGRTFAEQAAEVAPPLSEFVVVSDVVVAG